MSKATSSTPCSSPIGSGARARRRRNAPSGDGEPPLSESAGAPGLAPSRPGRGGAEPSVGGGRRLDAPEDRAQEVDGHPAVLFRERLELLEQLVQLRRKRLPGSVEELIRVDLDGLA